MHYSIIIMGVSGSGKSTIGKLLSKKLNIDFIEGDEYHSNESLKKLSSGITLTDNDRIKWLNKLNSIIHKKVTHSSCVVSCSALKKKYRSMLRKNISNRIKFVYLEGSYSLINERLIKRKNHFMSNSLLKSQFKALEIPSNSIKIDIRSNPVSIVETILKNINKGK